MRVGENNMQAINTLVEQRNALRREADRLDRQSEATAVKGDELHAEAANLAALALEQREEIKRYDVAIGALGGEPKKKARPFTKKTSKG